MTDELALRPEPEGIEYLDGSSGPDVGPDTDAHPRARQVIADFIAAEVSGPGAEPSDMMLVQAQEMLDALAAAGLMVIEP